MLARGGIYWRDTPELQGDFLRALVPLGMQMVQNVLLKEWNFNSCALNVFHTLQLQMISSRSNQYDENENSVSNSNFFRVAILTFKKNVCQKKNFKKKCGRERQHNAMARLLWDQLIYWRFTQVFTPTHFSQVRSTHRLNSSNLPHIKIVLKLLLYTFQLDYRTNIYQIAVIK